LKDCAVPSKISIPTPRRVNGNSKGERERGVKSPIFLRKVWQ